MLLHDLAQRLGATLERGPAAGNLDVTRVMTLEDADAQSLSFIMPLA